MTPIILATKNEKEVEKYLVDAGWSKKIKSRISVDGKFGIDELRKWLVNFQWKENLDDKSVYIMSGLDELSIESQNLLLKFFEEMPENIVLVLSVTRLEKIIPTIMSRCFLVKFGRDKVELSSVEWKKMLAIWSGDLFDVIEFAAKKAVDDPRDWIDGIIIELSKANRQKANLKRVDVLNLAIECRNDLETNINPRLAIENFILMTKKMIGT